jgi:putative aldouronate transport system substrate-binding protein
VNVAPGPFGKYNPPITINYILPGIDGVEYSAENTADDNVWTRAWRDELGINAKLMWATTSAQFGQKWEATIASGDLPDILPLSDVNFQKFSQAGILADLTKAYADYAQPLMKEYLNRDGGAALGQRTVNGKLLAIVPPPGIGEYSEMLWLRTDWLKKLNLQPPKTLDDVINIARAFAKRDPDGNGKPDTIGIPMNKDVLGGFGWLMAGIDGFFYGYHAYPTSWLKDSSGR